MDRLVQRKYRLGRNTQLRSNRYAHMAASWDLQWPAEKPCLLPARIAPVDRIIPGVGKPVRPVAAARPAMAGAIRTSGSVKPRAAEATGIARSVSRRTATTLADGGRIGRRDHRPALA